MIIDVLLHTKQPLPAKLRGMFGKRGMGQQETLDDLSQEARSQGAGLQGLNVFLTHGVDDDWVPIEAARKSYSILKDLGASLQLTEIEGMKHIGYSQVECDKVREFWR